jgi:hypothetical protein
MYNTNGILLYTNYQYNQFQNKEYNQYHKMAAVAVKIAIGYILDDQDQTDFGGYGASYPMDTGSSFSGGKEKGVKLITHLQPVPRYRKLGLYIHYIIRLHGIVLSQLRTTLALPYHTNIMHLAQKFIINYSMHNITHNILYFSELWLV